MQYPFADGALSEEDDDPEAAEFVDKLKNDNLQHTQQHKIDAGSLTNAKLTQRTRLGMLESAQQRLEAFE